MRKRKLLFLCVLTAALATGCTAQTPELAVISREPYEKTAYETTIVQKGDLSRSLQLTLHAQGYEQISYDATNEELKLEKVYVSVGDTVKKGDLLVSFQSDEIQEIIDTYSDQYEQNRLLAEHYRKLMQIDPEADYTEDLALLQDDMRVEQLYVTEAKERLAEYRIRAKKDGTITAMSEYLAAGVYVAGKNQITETCGTGNYTAEPPKGYTFQKGDTVTVKKDGVSCRLKVKSVSKKKIVFAPADGSRAFAGEKKLTLVVHRRKLKGAVYVENRAVHEKDGKRFVYVVGDDGYRDAAEVRVGEQVGTYVVIKSGLTGGEKVTIE